MLDEHVRVRVTVYTPLHVLNIQLNEKEFSVVVLSIHVSLRRCQGVIKEDGEVVAELRSLYFHGTSYAEILKQKM